MMIDCGRCDTRGVACQDCVVAVIAPPGTTRHLEADEMRALGVLADAGMIRTWAFPATKAS